MSDDLYTNSNVKEITPKQLIVKNNKLCVKSHNKGKYIIKFYAPWCGYCTKLKDILNELASDGYNIYAFNCDKYKDELSNITKHSNIKINGYPTILISDLNNELIEYDGDRTIESFKKHLN